MRSANLNITGFDCLIWAWLVLSCVGCGVNGLVSGTRPICDVSHGQTIVTAAEALIRQNHYPAVDCRTLLNNARQTLGPALQIDRIQRDAQICDPARFYGDVLQKNPDAACGRVAWEIVAGMVTGLDEYSKFIPPTAGDGGADTRSRSTEQASPLWWTILHQDTGYVRIAQFKPAMAADLWNILSAAEIKGLIVDLRDSRGGSLEAGLACANLFVNEGVLAILRGHNDRSNRTVHTRPLPQKFTKIPLAVLINGKTASAAEAFAAALQANGRATVVGQRSYGKGAVQADIPMVNGAVLRLTIAHMLTPDRKPIHGQGIEPDVRVEKSGWIFFADVPKNKKALRQDPVVQQALRILNRTESTAGSRSSPHTH